MILPDSLIFKNDNIKKQWESQKLSKRLETIIFALSGYIWHQFKKPLILTEIYRTQEEQDQIYANDPKYKEQKFVSPHQVWRAVDCRISDFKDDELKKIQEFLFSRFIYNTKDPRYKIVLVHNIGFGNHLHIQVSDSNTQLI